LFFYQNDKRQKALFTKLTDGNRPMPNGIIPVSSYSKQCGGYKVNFPVLVVVLVIFHTAWQ